ncbi:MAG: hypothetical protein AB7P07_03350 [Hyphomonadaceae bacterium]
MHAVASGWVVRPSPGSAAFRSTIEDRFKNAKALAAYLGFTLGCVSPENSISQALRKVQSLIEPAAGALDHEYRGARACFAKFQVAKPALDHPAAAPQARACAADIRAESAPPDASQRSQTCNTKEK